jgi:hypothetical protein
MRTNCLRVALTLLISCSTSTYQSNAFTLAEDTAAALRMRIEALRPANIAWRQIQWKSCLLEGLKESREKNKPLMLWIFIDRPVDDARC